MRDIRQQAEEFVSTLPGSAYAIPLRDGKPTRRNLFGRTRQVVPDDAWSDANGYGVVPAGLTVIDFDSYQALTQWQQEHGAPTDTLIVKTPRGEGWHYYYTGETEQCSPAKKVDIRSGPNGYVVGPGTTGHKPEHQGRAYYVIDSKPVRPLPSTYRSAIVAGSRDQQAAVSDALSGSDVIPEGLRESTIIAAGGMLTHYLDDEQLLHWINDFNRKRCSPPLPPEDIKRVYEQIRNFSDRMDAPGAAAALHDALHLSEIDQGLLNEDPDLIERVRYEKRVLEARRIVAAGSQPPFDYEKRLLSPLGIQQLPDPTWAIDELWPQVPLSVVYGPPSSKKSYSVLNMMLLRAMAAGTNPAARKYIKEATLGEVATPPFFGYEVAPARVLYLNAEGTGGLGQRLRAWRYRLAKTLYAWSHDDTSWITNEFVNGDALIEPEFNLALRMVDALIEDTFFVYADSFAASLRFDDFLTRLKAHNGFEPDVIVVDTFRRYSGGTEENSNTEVGSFIDAVIGRAAETVVIHHSGHAEGSRARGASAWQGDGDVVFHVEDIEPPQDGEIWSKWTATKMKDAQLPGSIHLKWAALGGGIAIEDVYDQEAFDLLTGHMADDANQERAESMNDAEEDAAWILATIISYEEIETLARQLSPDDPRRGRQRVRRAVGVSPHLNISGEYVERTIG